MNESIINKLLNITESYKAPERMMQLISEKETREELFRKFLEIESNIEYEWFQQYFEEEHSDRKNKKQDFTPNSIASLVAKLTGQGNTYHECAAGTGILLIKHWSETRRNTRILLYDPRNYWYQVEELSDRALPFLLFNMSIRGMNGVVLHGDSLERRFKNVYFVRNVSKNFQAFSEIIKMEHTEELRDEFNILEWRD